ncbi:MAG: M18 family aminopeptidase [Emergencia sp.]|nr:M18 family aminopeptidase [Emergencia sp.]
MYREINRELLDFLQKSPSCFHAVDYMKRVLSKQGFTELKEEKYWEIKPGGSYFVLRGDAALIAFTIPQTGISGWRIMTSHCDSPTFKIKENPEITVESKYVQLNTEGYGGMIKSTWLDRPLSIAGRVMVRTTDGALSSKLVNIDRDLLLIPNASIHMNREINKGYVYNNQKDMLPLFGEMAAKDKFMSLIAEAAGILPEEILSHDLFLYNRQAPSIWGAEEEFISAGKLDDLQCAFASLKGFLDGPKKDFAAVHCVYDNEEVGSASKQGAASTFLKDTINRITESLSMSRQEELMTIANSFMISADNAHALHPNHTEMADPVNRPVLNGGPVIKYSAEQKYCTDAVSAAMFKALCEKANVPYQTFTNRSDKPGGSTLGSISNCQVALNSIDIGLPQLAMHSSYETAGAKDTAYLVEVAKVFFA